MRKLFSLMLLACCPLLWFGCGGGSDSEPAPPKVTPTNLTLDKTISTDGSGKVTFTAKADNAVKYIFYFGETIPDNPVTSDNGIIDYTYAFTGSYTVKVMAVSTDNLGANKSTTVDVQKTLQVVWMDDFEGTSLNAANWVHETGNNGGWGNNELEYYQPDNTTVADGFLTITAKQESVGGQNYTSSRIKTLGLQEFKYGQVEIRAKLPYGQGIWPALWMLGSDIVNTPWPACGEIDIMEMVGGTNGNPGNDARVYGTVHWANASNNWTYVGGNTALSSGKFADDFHLFQLLWTPKKITWSVDGVDYFSKDTSPDEMSEFRNKFFFIFNIAVGGNWPHGPDDTTTFPQTMVVDYIKISQ